MGNKADLVAVYDFPPVLLRLDRRRSRVGRCLPCLKWGIRSSFCPCIWPGRTGSTSQGKPDGWQRCQCGLSSSPCPNVQGSPISLAWEKKLYLNIGFPPKLHVCFSFALTYPWCQGRNTGKFWALGCIQWEQLEWWTRTTGRCRSSRWGYSCPERIAHHTCFKKFQ